MNELKVFENEEFGKIRAVMIDNEPWCMAKDVAVVLGYKNGRDALAKHVDNEDRGVAKCDTLGGSQDLTIINESGVYALVFGSKLESAKRFKHWITHDVLPTIRKTGGYVANDDLFINTYLPTANDDTKLMFLTTLATVRQLTEGKPAASANDFCSGPANFRNAA